MILWLPVAILAGLLTAFIARSKGRRFPVWLAYGTLLGFVALPHVLLLRNDDEYENDSFASAWETRDGDRPSTRVDGEPEWMRSEAISSNVAMEARDSIVRKDIAAVWSEDAFARIAGGDWRAAAEDSVSAAPSGAEVLRDSEPDGAGVTWCRPSPDRPGHQIGCGRGPRPRLRGSSRR